MPALNALSPIIRPAELPDLEACLSLDPSYLTEYAWQMEAQTNGEHVGAAFRSVRLPRSMRVTYPRDARQLKANWQRCEEFLVAEHKDKIIGYAALTTQDDQATACITDLVVDQHRRKRGVGAALVSAAAQWCKPRGVTRLMAELQTKNYPAICFYQKLGFVFCGFNDHYYANQDIAVFFVLGIK
jgi:GNAT superfamily N-acetyltransferase